MYSRNAGHPRVSVRPPVKAPTTRPATVDIRVTSGDEALGEFDGQRHRPRQHRG